jgi:hypothetical protein
MRMCLWLLASCGLVCLTTMSGGAPPDPIERDLTILRDAGLSTEDAALLDFFRKRTLRDDDLEKLKTLIKQLGDDSFEVRERASTALIALGPVAEGALKEAAQSSDPEVKQRANVCLAQLAKSSTGTVIQAAAHVLAAHKPTGSAEVLFQYLPFVPDESTADTVRQALARTGVRDGKPDKVLVDGLEDKLAVKRLGAALALYRSGLEDIRPQLMKLLKDPDMSIRFRFALMLSELKEREAVPVLIEMIPDVKPQELRQIQDLLERVARDKTPKDAKGSAEAKQLRDTWRDWWKESGEKIDFAKLDLKPQVLGRTLIIELGIRPGGKGGAGGSKVYEIDKDGKELWHVDTARAMDAKVVADDRVLICETRQVTERNTNNGEVVWQFQSELPVYGVQRLPDGNTFMNCRNAVIEVDKDGKEVFRYNNTNGLSFAAAKLKSGDYGILSSTGQFQVVNSEGKEVKSFKTATTRSIYGSVVLPDGGVVLLDSSAPGKVREYDAEGKETFEATVTGATGVSKLPNGNILVTCASANTIVELDRDGKEVAKHTVDNRPVRAYGR